jgi:catechol 2,3-dioxygenase-like lactoylglutathione lyase family enzyme
MLCACGTKNSNNPAIGESKGADTMSLGNFSVSLAVKDLAKSREFYEKLGFHAITPPGAQNWAIMQSDTATIGLFQGMFEKNIMTFNPGWDRESNTLPEFQNVRELQARFKAQGLALTLETDPDGTGIGSLMLEDPDGNQILIDQHVP